MKKFREIFATFAEWLEPEHQHIFIQELPDVIRDKIIYIVGSANQPWLIAFNCPCGCRNLIQLNLLRSGNPCWRFTITKKRKINISPSVWRTTGCKSHFFVRKSKIDWVKDYEDYQESESQGFFGFWK